MAAGMRAVSDLAVQRATDPGAQMHCLKIFFHHETVACGV